MTITNADGYNGSKILSGWKEIARYLGRGIRTVQRWEELGLPVLRPRDHFRSPVCASASEIDAWLHRGDNGTSRVPLETTAEAIAELHARLAQLELENERLKSEIQTLRDNLATTQSIAA